MIGPASSAYFAAQRTVAGELAHEEALDAILDSLEKLGVAKAGALMDEARDVAHASEYYRVMRRLRPLMESERRDAGLGPTTDLSAP